MIDIKSLILLVCISFYVTCFAQEQKIVVITGSSKSLGLEMAKKYQAENYHVIFASRSSPPEEFLGVNKGTFIKLDLLDAKSTTDYIPIVMKRFGKIDLLIHNAAMTISESAYLNNGTDVINKSMRTNYLSPVEMTAQYLKFAQESGQSAKVIYISSIGAVIPRENFAGYSASKAASESYFMSLQDELRRVDNSIIDHQISIIRPALINSEYTPGIQGAAEDLETAKALRSLSPTTPEDVVSKVFETSQKKKMPLLTNVGFDGKALSLMRKLLPYRAFQMTQLLAEQTATSLVKVNQCSKHFFDKFNSTQIKFMKGMTKLSVLVGAGYAFSKTDMGENVTSAIDFAYNFWNLMRNRSDEINTNLEEVISKQEKRDSYYIGKTFSKSCSGKFQGMMTMEGNLESFMEHWQHALELGLGSNHDALYGDVVKDLYAKAKDNGLLKMVYIKVYDRVEVEMKDGQMTQLNEFIDVYQLGIKVSTQKRLYLNKFDGQEELNPFEETMNYYNCDPKKVTEFYNKTYDKKYLSQGADIEVNFSLGEVKNLDFIKPSEGKEFEHNMLFFGF